jgi:hypothetical protein
MTVTETYTAEVLALVALRKGYCWISDVQVEAQPKTPAWRTWMLVIASLNQIVQGYLQLQNTS